MLAATRSRSNEALEHPRSIMIKSAVGRDCVRVDVEHRTNKKVPLMERDAI
jgi:hypothetical protein